MGFYGPDAMLCAGDVRVGPLRHRFWAVAEPGRPLREGTSLRAGGVSIDGPRVEIDAEGVHADLTAEESGGIATLHPDGRAGYVWTRKQAGVRMRGSLAVDGRALELDGRGAIDDTAGYHARRTSWRWSAGVGRTVDGQSVAWNLVEGVNDERSGSERAIWVGGEPFEPAPVRFAEDLSAIGFSDGTRLEFREWPGAVREDHSNLIVLRTDYRQPFGTFSGDLPGGLRVAEGYGVMETHSARW